MTRRFGNTKPPTSMLEYARALIPDLEPGTEYFERVEEWDDDTASFLRDMKRASDSGNAPTAGQIAYLARIYNRFVDRDGYGAQVLADLERRGLIEQKGW